MLLSHPSVIPSLLLKPDSNMIIIVHCKHCDLVMPPFHLTLNCPMYVMHLGNWKSHPRDSGGYRHHPYQY